MTLSQTQPKKRGCLARGCLNVTIIGVLVIGFLVYWFFPRFSPPLTINEATTRITSPLKADGTPDYLTEMNRHLGEGMTAERNAAAILARIWQMPDDMTDQELAWIAQQLGTDQEMLGITPYVGLVDYARQNLDRRLFFPPGVDESEMYDELDDWAMNGSLFQDLYLHDRDEFEPSDEQLQQIREAGLTITDQLYEALKSHWTMADNTLLEPALDEVSSLILDPWTREQYPLAADWLDDHEQMLANVAKAVERDGYFLPLVPDRDSVLLFDARIVQVHMNRFAATMLITRAMLHVSDDSLDAAWTDIYTAWRLGRLTSYDSSMLGLLYNASIELMARGAAEKILTHRTITKDLLKRMRDDLSQLPPQRTAGDVLDVDERFFAIDASLRILGESWASGSQMDTDSLIGFLMLWGDKNDVLVRINSIYDDVVAAARMPRAYERMQRIDTIRGHMSQREVAYDDDDMAWRILRLFLMSPGYRRDTASELAADLIAGVVVPNLYGLVEMEAISRQYLELMHVAIALSKYAIDHDGYPDTLNALVPDYLDALPTDAFSGQALLYRKDADAVIVYSVGPDGLDDGGVDTRDTIAREATPSGRGDMIIRLEKP